LRADCEVHRAADGRNRVGAAGVPVRQIAAGGDLERAEDGEIEVAAADHAEGIGVVEIRAAREQRDRLLPRVDEVLVDLALGRLRPDAEDAVLAVQDDLPSLRQIVPHQRGQAVAQVDVGAFRDVARDARGHLLAIELFHHAAFMIAGATRTTRWTKMLGVTIVSGSRLPNSTISRTCTTVVFAAAAMIGPKLRALLR